LRDISFGGGRVILMGLKKFLLGKDVQLQLEFEDSDAPCDLQGTIADVEPVQDRQDISVAVVRFAEKSVPMFYKQKINSYITAVKRPQPVTAPSAMATASAR
jgi:Tfp pilus assembly protein PilZ